jgi:hypothetical protein
MSVRERRKAVLAERQRGVKLETVGAQSKVAVHVGTPTIQSEFINPDYPTTRAREAAAK